MTRRFGDRGQVAGIEALPFGLLVFVIGALLVAHAWAVVDAKVAAVAAAREAARAVVEGPADSRAARAHGVAAAEQAIEGHGRSTDNLRIDIDVTEPVLVRCAPVVVVVRHRVPALRLPWVGPVGSMDVRAQHRELVDPYRDGLPGPSRCA
jgi:hypothetical protein